MEESKTKVVILGGVHGDDRLGVEVLTYYFKKPNPLLQLMLGNYQAVEKGQKFIDFDLLKAGKGDITCSTSIEKCRAGEIHEVLSQYDYAVDVHGSHVNEDLLILTNDDPETIKFAQTLGVERGIVIPKDNYLIESVKHNVTLIKKVEAKPDPSKEEIAETILKLDGLDLYFNNQKCTTTLTLYKLNHHEENLIDFVIENNVDDLIEQA